MKRLLPTFVFALLMFTISVVFADTENSSSVPFLNTEIPSSSLLKNSHLTEKTKARLQKISLQKGVLIDISPVEHLSSDRYFQNTESLLTEKKEQNIYIFSGFSGRMEWRKVKSKISKSGASTLITLNESSALPSQKNVLYVAQNSAVISANSSGFVLKETSENGDIIKLSGQNSFFDDSLTSKELFSATNKNYVLLDVAPDSTPEVSGEIVAYNGLAGAAIEQTRDLFHSLVSNINGDRLANSYCRGTDSYDCIYDGSPLNRFWISPVYTGSKNQAPYLFKAEILGTDAGYDMQTDAYNRLGIFVSLRQGEYDFNGKNDYYLSHFASEININSYLGGLYYRYDKDFFHSTATVFAGVQKAEIETANTVKAKTNGVEYGAAVETGFKFNVATDLNLESGVSLQHIEVSYDDIKDIYRNEAKYDTIRNTEAEIYLKAEKTFHIDEDKAKIYIKPSIIKSWRDGNVEIAGLKKTSAVDDVLLERIEVGGSFQLDNNLSFYGNAAYTTGDDYEAASFNAGIKYSF